MNDTQLLPDDLAVCQALIIEQRQKISEQDHTLVEQARAITELHGKVEEQKLTINELMQRAFRNRSERYVEDPDQLKLDFGNTPEATQMTEQNSRNFYARWADYVSARDWNVLLGGA